MKTFNPSKNALKWAIMAFLTITSCGVIKEHPIETKNEVKIQYIDSLRIKDSTIFHTETLIRDYDPDTLVLQGLHSTSKSWVDMNVIKGELKEDAWKERIVYVDKLVYRDSIQIIEKEVPINIEVPVKFIPKWCWTLLCIFIFEIIFVFFYFYRKIF